MSDTVIGGRYRVEYVLGRGGMSEVYCAHDVELERRVAVKLLAPDADSARFEREARAVASLAHPNVMQLYDYGEDNGRPYMVLEFVPGGTLEERLAATNGKPLPDDESQAIAAGVAAGLAHAHARGVVHRDLKPANVLFDDEGRPKLGDFGIARMAAREGTLTEAGTVLGTAAYISPEQAAGAPATPASDVYSFGVILYRMLTGRLPFESSDPLELVMMHRDVPPPPITDLRDDPPGLLESTATAALLKDPAERPHDGAALLAALGVAGTAATSALADDATRALPVAAPATAPTTVSPAEAPPPGPPPRSRVPLLVAALLVLLLAGGALAYEMTRPASSSNTTPVTTLPSISLPRSSTQPTTAQPTTTEASTTAATTSTAQTTAQPTTTQQTTTAHTTTQAPPTTTVPTTTSPPTTTELPTTAVTTLGTTLTTP
jgi:eukaryotic-like serine/threonine-protein kinase